MSSRTQTKALQLINLVWMDGPLEDSTRISTVGYLIKADDFSYTIVPEIALPDMEMGGDTTYCPDDELVILRSTILEQYTLQKTLIERTV